MTHPSSISLLQVRARAFDLLYNLALHSALLAPAPLPPSLAATQRGVGVPPGGLSASTQGGISTPLAGSGALQHGLPGAQQLAAAAAAVPGSAARSPLPGGPGAVPGSARVSVDNLQRLGQGGGGAASAGAPGTPRDVSGGGAAPQTPGGGFAANHVQLMRWLRALTFQLVADIAKVWVR